MQRKEYVDDGNEARSFWKNRKWVMDVEILCNLFKECVSNKHHKDKPLSSEEIKSTK